MSSLPPIERECFFITPIGEKGSSERNRSDKVLREVVAKAAKELDLHALRGDRIALPVEVTAQVVHHLTEARAAVADLTGKNPNVFYELAIRKSAGKPVVLIAERGEDLPFDIHTMKTIFYDLDDPKSMRECRQEVVEQLRNSYPAPRDEVGELVRLSYSQRERTPFGYGTLPGYEIGCRVGRRRIEGGIVNVQVPTTGLPSSDEVHELVPPVSSGTASNQLGSINRDDFLAKFHGVVAKLVKQAARKRISVQTIGVAVPGGVAISQGRFSAPVEGVAFEAGEPIAADLADYLCKHVGRDALGEVFGVRDQQSLRTRIHVDNDARCAARWIASKHSTDPRWRDFCCLFVGSGVGGGLVLDGKVYYGTYDRAGEVGHVALHQEDQMHIDGVTLEPRLCSCGQRAFHFETLAGVGGLGHIASSIDAKKLAEVRLELDSSLTPDQLPSGAEWSIDAYDASGFDVLKAFAQRLDLRKQYEPYLGSVFKAYAKVFGIGIGALINVLDVDRVAVCGAVPEQLRHRGLLIATLAALPSQVLVEPAKAVFEWGDMPEWGWRGAALLSRDPDYLARR